MGRKKNGSGIVEGVVGLMVVMGGVVAGSLFVLDTGTGIYFKNKLLIVTNIAAQHYAQNTKENVAADVQSLMEQAGMTPNDLHAGPDTTGTRFTVTNTFPLFGNGSILPLNVQLSDCEPISNAASGGGGMNNAIGYMVIDNPTLNGSGQLTQGAAIVPVVGTATLSLDTLKISGAPPSITSSTPLFMMYGNVQGGPAGNPCATLNGGTPASGAVPE